MKTYIISVPNPGMKTTSVLVFDDYLIIENFQTNSPLCYAEKPINFVKEEINFKFIKDVKYRYPGLFENKSITFYLKDGNVITFYSSLKCHMKEVAERILTYNLENPVDLYKDNPEWMSSEELEKYFLLHAVSRKILDAKYVMTVFNALFYDEAWQIYEHSKKGIYSTERSIIILDDMTFSLDMFKIYKSFDNYPPKIIEIQKTDIKKITLIRNAKTNDHIGKINSDVLALAEARNKELDSSIAGYTKLNKDVFDMAKKPKSNTKIDVSGAVVGGLLLGPAGAVLGGQVKENQATINNYTYNYSFNSDSEAQIFTENHFLRNVLIIEYCNHMSKENLKIFFVLSEESSALDWINNAFENIVYEDGAQEKIMSSKQQEKATDIFSEIRKYKELLDEGILTQEEFDKKKSEILNL